MKRHRILGRKLHETLKTTLKLLSEDEATNRQTLAVRGTTLEQRYLQQVGTSRLTLSLST
jgi:hypothetical protein